MTFGIGPRELPELRNHLFTHPDTIGFVSDMYDSAVKHMPLGDKKIFIAHVGAVLQRGALHYVDHAFSNLVCAAAPSMPNFPLSEQDLPSPYGLMLFSEPFPDPRWSAPVHYLVTWYQYKIMSGGGGMNLIWFVNRDDVAPLEGWDGEERLAMPKYVPVMVTLSDFGTVFASEELEELKADGASATKLLQYVLATWNLQRQRLTATRVARPDRASNRRLDRANDHTDRDVRVINLRVVESRSERDSANSGRNYQHQWIVRGHWQNHWYSSIQKHRPIWISPFVKGPDGAPLLGGEKVYAWNK